VRQGHASTVRYRGLVTAVNEQMRRTRHGEMARWAGWLFAASGVLAFVGLLMPADGPRSVPAVVILSCADLLVAAVIAVLPARWWDVRRLTRLALVALVLCSLFVLSGAVPAFGYPTFFLILFAWIGLALPRGTALRLALPAAIAYALPPVLRHAAPPLATSVVVAVPLMVLLAETAASVVSRLDRLNSALLTAATSDDLTGVGNRRRADELLRALVPGDAVIMIDIDHFKQVNDRLGHAAGDDVLARLGGLLREVIRDDDVVARYGGEEFVVVARGARRTSRSASSSPGRPSAGSRRSASASPCTSGTRRRSRRSRPPTARSTRPSARGATASTSRRPRPSRPQPDPGQRSAGAALHVGSPTGSMTEGSGASCAMSFERLPPSSSIGSAAGTASMPCTTCGSRILSAPAARRRRSSPM
jgi:GGDEF domain-containing protein